VLVVVDNFETITDGALLSWLLNLPEPSKALITTREYKREFRRSSWPVDLRGMTEEEARELIAERIHVLKIERLVGDLMPLEPLLVATGGNPKAIEITMGLLKYEHRPLQQVIDDLYAARGELFDDLFARAWAQLDEAARRVLLVTAFFPASASREALCAAADVKDAAFERAMERLADLALLDVQQLDLQTPPRHALHPLVRAFTQARLRETAGFEEGARTRWIAHYAYLVRSIEGWWRDLTKLSILDPEYEAMSVAIEWADQHQCYTELLEIAGTFSYYCQIRGFWDTRVTVLTNRLHAAVHLADPELVIKACCGLIDVLSRQGKLSAAQAYFEQLQQLIEGTEIRGRLLADVPIAMGIYWLSTGNVTAAQDALQRALDSGAHRHRADRILNQRWLAVCLYRQGHVEAAKSILHDVLSITPDLEHIRAIAYIRILLATIELDLGDVEDAAEKLNWSIAWARANGERERLAQALFQYARLHTFRSDLPVARTSLAEAIDLFERLGMSRELAEAREELARLEEEETSAD
jgi:tetratricopeptide (TPR) repeat protein